MRARGIVVARNPINGGLFRIAGQCCVSVANGILVGGTISKRYGVQGGDNGFVSRPSGK